MWTFCHSALFSCEGYAQWTARRAAPVLLHTARARTAAPHHWPQERRVDKATLDDDARLQTCRELTLRGHAACQADKYAEAAELYHDATDYLIDPPPKTSPAAAGEAKRSARGSPVLPASP